MSLYAEYIKERDGKDVIESDHGFISYLIKGDECYLEDIYVIPSYRQRSEGSALFFEAEAKAKESGCKFLSSRIVPTEKGATVSMKAHLARGFSIHSAQLNTIIMIKELL